jgi:cytochrome b pre-mRNA-processing protein 3
MWITACHTSSLQHPINFFHLFAVFNLEKTFKTTFSLLVLHMWFYLRRIKQEGNYGVEFGQYLYEIYNHDVELRVSKAGVSCILQIDIIFLP